MARSALLLCLLLLAACVSDTTTRRTGQFPWKKPGESAKAPPAPRTSGKGNVQVPQEVLGQIMGFINSQKFVVADRIEIDVSRIPFQAAMVPVNDPHYVEVVEVSNPDIKVIGQLLRSRSPAATTPRDFPKLRVGDGIDLVASREIQVRSYLEVDRARPVFLRIRGLGHAVYRDPVSGKRIEADAITLKAEVFQTAAGMKYRESIQ